jgi:hypothetical protein
MTHTTIPEAQLRVARRSQKLLGNGLASLYSAVTPEAVPADFLLLLEGADRKRLSTRGVE